MKEGLITRLGKKLAPYLLATSLSFPFASCTDRRIMPSEPIQEQYSPQEQNKAEQAQIWYNEASQDNLISTKELNDLETKVNLPHTDVKQKALSLTQLASETPNCDVNKDGKTDIFDLLYLLKNLSNGEACDVNKDGKTDVFDLLDLLGVLSGSYGKYNVYGKVLGIHAGNPEYSPVPNAIVEFKDKNWNLVKADTADANANFSVRLPAGDYNMCVKADDYWDYPISENNPFINGTPEHPEYNRTFYFEIEGLNSNTNKDGIILNKDIDYEFFAKVMKNEDNGEGLPVAKPVKNPRMWVQENTRSSIAKPAAEYVAISDIPNFQREFVPVLTDSSQADYRAVFVPDGHPKIGYSALACYENNVDWNTNTVTGGTIWYYDGLFGTDELSKGVYREEVSQIMMGLHDIFNPAYSTTTLYHDSGIAKDFTKLDRDNIGTIYHLVPKGY